MYTCILYIRAQWCDKTFGAKLIKVGLDVEGRNAGKLEIRGDEMVFTGVCVCMCVCVCV